MHPAPCSNYAELIELAALGVLVSDQGETDEQAAALQRLAEATDDTRAAAIAAARALDVPMTPTGPLVESVPFRVY